MDNQKQKQAFLFKEIIEKNYDPEQFQEYLIKNKEGGQDLENWSFKELEAIVNKFQKYNDKDIKDVQTKQLRKNQDIMHEQDRKSIIDEFIQSEDYDKSTVKDKKPAITLEIDYENNNQAFGKSVDCIQSLPNSLIQTPNVYVNVFKFQKKDGGIFEQSYVSYFLNTPVLNKTVERRYSDFQWLRSVLEMLHPGLPIPPIAKKGQFRRYDDKHLRKRLMILQMFLNKLLEIHELRSDQVLENFLKVEDKVGFEKFKANYPKSKKMIPFKNIKNSKGNITLSFDPKANIFLQRSQRHLTSTQSNVKQLYKEFKSAATSLEACGSTLKVIGDQCEILNETQRKFRKQNEIPYSGNNFYTILNEAVNRLAQQFINQARIFRTQTYSILKYERLYMLNLVQSFQNLKSFQDKYLQEKLALGKKKLKLFEEGNVEKWQLQKKIDRTKKIQALNEMLPKQTRKLAKLRDVYGLFNNEMHQEIKRYFLTKNLQLANKLSSCCKKQTRMCTQMMMIWVDAETNIMGLRQNKLIKKI